MPEPLSRVVAGLTGIPVGDSYEVGPTIFAQRPWTPDSLAVVLQEDAVDGVAPSRPEYGYLLEVDIAKEVLGVWSDWRAGAQPTDVEAAQAVIHYATHDAYQPVD